MLSKLFEALYLKVFVSIITTNSKYLVYIEVCKKDTVVQTAEKSFDIKTSKKKVSEFVESYTQETPYNYISYMDESAEQGAIPTSSNMSEYFDVGSSFHKNYNDKWLYYTSKEKIGILQDEYNDLGVDYIFSPFLVLAHIFKDKIETSFSMVVLVDDNSVCLSVFDHSDLFYAEYFLIERAKKKSKIEEDSLDDEFELDDYDSIELADVDALEEEDELDDAISELDDFADMEDLDDLSDITDLDDMDDIEDFADEEAVLEAEDTFMDEPQKIISPIKMNDDYKVFLMIQSAVKSFYEDEKFDSKFIESVHIADTRGDSSDLKQYLEEEMFVNVYNKRIELNIEICELAKAEQL